MWVVKSKFIGNQGTYTITEESATSELYANAKFTRQLMTWLERIGKRNVSQLPKLMKDKFPEITNDPDYYKAFNTFLHEQIQEE